MNPERRQNLFLLLLLPGFAVFFFALYYSISQGVELYAFERVKDSTLSGAAILEDWLDTQTKSTALLADLADSPATGKQLFDDFVRSTGGDTIFYAAMHMDDTAITLFDKSGIWSFGPEAEHFQQWWDVFHASSDIVTMRGPIKALHGEFSEMLFLRALISSDSKRHGELALRLPLNVLADKLDSLPLLSRGERRYAITDRKGVILACTRNDDSHSCLRHEPEFEALLSSSDASGETGRHFLQGQEFIIAGADVGKTGWRLHMLSPVEYEAHIRPLLYWAFGAAWLFLSAFVLLLGYHSSRHGLYKDLSQRDHLTGAGNRLAFELALRQLRKKSSFPLCLVILDVDGLKILNDSFGHKAGDALLRRVNILLQRCIREDDKLFRIGGDEFAILLPGTSAQAAQALVHRIREQSAQLRQHTNLPPIFLSLGLAEAEDEQELGALFMAADKAMYADKENGRQKSRTAILAWVEKSGNVVDRRGI